MAFTTLVIFLAPNCGAFAPLSLLRQSEGAPGTPRVIGANLLAVRIDLVIMTSNRPFFGSRKRSSPWGSKLVNTLASG